MPARIKAAPKETRMRLRAIRNCLILAGLTLVVGCGHGPDGPSPTMFQTTVRVVSALNPQVGLSQVMVTVANAREQQTDEAGVLVIRTESPATVSLRLRHPAFVERETSVRVPDDRPVELSLIPSTHDLAAFEEFSPRATGLQRWTRNPRLLLLSHAVDYGAATLGFREFPVINRAIGRTQLDCLATGLGAELAPLTGGRLSWTSVDIAEVEPGTRFRTDVSPEGTIVVLMSVSLGTAGRGTAYLGTEPFVLTRGAMWLTADVIDFCLTSLLYRHELGHALGYQHVTRTTSIMSPVGLPAALTEFDRNSIAILFQRRPGNLLPDRDPPGISVNVSGRAARQLVQPMR
jgi:hypothetical protein